MDKYKNERKKRAWIWGGVAMEWKKKWEWEKISFQSYNIALLLLPTFIIFFPSSFLYVASFFPFCFIVAALLACSLKTWNVHSVHVLQTYEFKLHKSPKKNEKAFYYVCFFSSCLSEDKLAHPHTHFMIHLLSRSRFLFSLHFHSDIIC